MAEVKSLRSAMLVSSARVTELEAGLEQARRLLELRSRDAELAARRVNRETLTRLAEVTARLEWHRRKLASTRKGLRRRDKALTRARRRLEELDRIQGSRLYRVQRRLARVPLLARRLR